MDFDDYLRMYKERFGKKYQVFFTSTEYEVIADIIKCLETDTPQKPLELDPDMNY